jgi:hypothetical protein
MEERKSPSSAGNRTTISGSSSPLALSLYRMRYPGFRGTEGNHEKLDQDCSPPPGIPCEHEQIRLAS